MNSDDIIKQMQSELDKALASTVTLDDDESDPEFISTGVDVLDLLLGGGIAMNKLTLIAGDPGTFKSTLAISVCAQLQRKYERSLVLYLDSESATSVKRMRQLGLKHVAPKTNLTVEKVFATIDAVILFKEEKKLLDVPTIVVWDSIANTPTEAELKTNDVNSVIGLKARIISSRLPVVINMLNKYNITLLFINQFRDKVQIGPFTQANDLRHLNPQKTLPGGNSPKFNASQFLQLKVSRVFNPQNSPYGFRATVVNVKTVKNKFFPDGYEAEIVINPATGAHNLYTNFELLKANKKVVSSSWSYLKDYPDKKFRVKELEKIYNTDTVFRQEFDRIVKELLNEMRAKMANFEDIVTVQHEEQSLVDTQSDTANTTQVVSDLASSEQSEAQTAETVSTETQTTNTATEPSDHVSEDSTNEQADELNEDDNEQDTDDTNKQDSVDNKLEDQNDSTSGFTQTSPNDQPQNGIQTLSVPVLS